MPKHVLRGFNLAWVFCLAKCNLLTFLSNRIFKLLIHKKKKKKLFKIEKAPISNDPEGIATCLCRMRSIYLASDIQKDAHCVAPLWELFSVRAINSMLICVSHFPPTIVPLSSLLHPLSPRSHHPQASNSDRLTAQSVMMPNNILSSLKLGSIWLSNDRF